MAITFNSAIANDILDGIDAVFNSGKLQIWTGTPPGAGNAATGTKLVEITLPVDAFAAAAAKSKAKNGTWQSTGLAAGNAGYFRLTNSVGDRVIEGTVTVTGGGGDLTLDNISIASGQTVTVTSFTLTHP